MIAARLHAYHDQLKVEEIPEPQITGPHDVIVRIGGAGLCRTDLHIVEGSVGGPQWGVVLPYTLGHENAGWVREVGSAVDHLHPGDPVILHPLVTCGFCRPCRAGDDVHCLRAPPFRGPRLRRRYGPDRRRPAPRPRWTPRPGARLTSPLSPTRA